MELTFASPLTIPRMRVPTAPAPRFRTRTICKRVNREQSPARVVRGAGAHAVTGPAMPVDDCNRPAGHTILVHSTSWA